MISFYIIEKPKTFVNGSKKPWEKKRSSNKCTPSCDFASQPARVIHHNGDDIAKTIRQLNDFDCVPLPKKHVEINPSQALIVLINNARYDGRGCSIGMAETLAAQIYDNCLINAGLMDDARSMVVRMNDIMMALLQTTAQQQALTSDEA